MRWSYARGRSSYPHPLTQHFVGAGRQLQIPGNQDFNGSTQEGLGLYQCNMKNGRRWTGVDAYLRLALGRSNLAVETNVNVRHVQLSGRKATGVVLNDGQTITANRRVILCAGAIGTPSILLRSGIGPQGGTRFTWPAWGKTFKIIQPHRFPIKPPTLGMDWRGVIWVGFWARRFNTWRAVAVCWPAQPLRRAALLKQTRQAQPDVQFHFGPFNFVILRHGLFADACVLKALFKRSTCLNADGSPSIDLNLLSDERD